MPVLERTFVSGEAIGGIAPALRGGTMSIGGIAPALRGGTMSIGGIAPALRGGTMSIGGIAPALRGGTMSVKLAVARQLALAASVGLGAGAAGTARAFSEPRSYYDDPAEGGGGGRWFTGSPAEGYGCSECHTGGPPQPLHIEGLPSTGYVPGGVYDVRIAWPEVAARAAVLATTPGVPGASLGLVAEFVTETGLGAGTVEIAGAAAATPGELCTFPPDARAAQLYSVKSGEPVKEQQTSCVAGMLEERCVLAVADCGAQEVRLRWTAPATWERAIWFSTGFVTTDTSSDTPEGDAVTEGSFPLRPVGSEGALYQSRLEGSCSAGGSGRSSWPTSAALASAALLFARTRTRRARRRS